MFHIKICGVRRPEDIEAVAQSRADAVGLNFFARSVRYLDPAVESTAALSRQAAESGLVRVGVFVNESVGRIVDTVAKVGLQHVQLHGDETLDVAVQLIAEGLSVIRAIRLPAAPLPPDAIADRSTDWVEAGCKLLLDVDAGSQYGGSGHSLDWQSVRRWSDQNPQIDWVLAGGLDPHNVSQAIQVSGARSVDVASGVEQPRGQKSPQLIGAFARSAGNALDAA